MVKMTFSSLGFSVTEWGQNSDRFVAAAPMGPLSFPIIDLFKFMGLVSQLLRIRKCQPYIQRPICDGTAPHL
jgi:hypothetical protein